MVSLYVKDPVFCIQNMNFIILVNDSYPVIRTKPDIGICVFYDLTDVIAGQSASFLCVVNNREVLSIENHLSCASFGIIEPHSVSRKEAFFQWNELDRSVISYKA